jgi:hypothetical protein
MRKIILTLIFTLLIATGFSINVYADEITITDRDVIEAFEAEDFLPEEIKNTLDQAKIDINSQNNYKNYIESKIFQ